MDRLGDIGAELQSPHFRTIWRAMCQARGAESFYTGVHDALERDVCHDQHNPDTDSGRDYYARCRQERAGGIDIDNPLSHWWWCEAKCLLRMLNGGSVMPNLFELAVFTLHQCTDRRRILVAASEIAQRAWRDDGRFISVSDARRLLGSIETYAVARRVDAAELDV